MSEKTCDIKKIDSNEDRLLAQVPVYMLNTYKYKGEANEKMFCSMLENNRFNLE